MGKGVCCALPSALDVIGQGAHGGGTLPNLSALGDLCHILAHTCRAERKHGQKILLIIPVGVPLRNWRCLFGNFEDWVESGEAQSWTMQAVLLSISANCYASIHTGVTPQEHGRTGNGNVFRIRQPDIFARVRKAGGVTWAVTHFFWSEFFYRHPSDYV